MTLRWLSRLLNLYPPYLGAGIRVRLGEDGRSLVVRMPLRFYNRNYVGTHYGGSLYSMCDPHFMLLLIHELGPGYIVWDKAATIRFRRPGKTTVTATFAIPEAEVEAIRRRVDAGEVVEPRFEVEVVDEAGEVMAEVGKVLHVRGK